MNSRLRAAPADFYSCVNRASVLTTRGSDAGNANLQPKPRNVQAASCRLARRCVHQVRLALSRACAQRRTQQQQHCASVVLTPGSVAVLIPTNTKSQIANATMKSQTRHSPLHMTLLFATCVIFVLQPRRARFGVRHALTVRRLRSPNSPRVTSESCAITRLIVGDLHSQPPFTPPIHSSTCTLHSSKSAFGSNT